MADSEVMKLPSLEELYSGELKLDESNQLNVLLNQEPPETWLKQHPIAKRKDANNKNVPVKYIPIQRIEYLLTKIFVRWRCEVLKVQLIGNSVQTTVRLHYLNPITGEWDWNDGVGAAALQTNKGGGATDFMQLKDSAVQLAAPSSKSYAMKDAAEMLGKIFGKDLNRADEVGYNVLMNRFDDPESMLDELRDLFAIKEEHMSPSDAAHIERIITNREVSSYKKALKQLKST